MSQKKKEKSGQVPLDLPFSGSRYSDMAWKVCVSRFFCISPREELSFSVSPPSSLPLHRVAHLFFWKGDPGQNFPPNFGAGLLQNRSLRWTPGPQRELQSVQDVHADQPPLTAKKNPGKMHETSKQNLASLNLRRRIRHLRTWRKIWQIFEFEAKFGSS